MVEIINSTTLRITPPEQAVQLIGDFTDWDKLPITLTGPIDIEVPTQSYVEYAFVDAAGTAFADPHNSTVALNPWWPYARAVALEGYVFPQEAAVGQTALQRIRLDSAVFGTVRRLMVADIGLNPKTTILVHDGVAYQRMGTMADIALQLHQQGRIEAVRLVFVEPTDRKIEYWFNPQYEAFLLQEVLPYVHTHYGATPKHALWGASMGGAVSLWLAARHPELFSHVGAQSPCLTLAPGGTSTYTDPLWLLEHYQNQPTMPLTLYTDTGVIEWLHQPNLQWRQTMLHKGYNHSFAVFKSGHNWVTWRHGLWVGLPALFVGTS